VEDANAGESAGQCLHRIISKTTGGFMKTDEKLTKLGETLHQLRFRSGDPLSIVAGGVGISKGHLNQIERAKVRNPSIITIQCLADFYNVPFSKLWK